MRVVRKVPKLKVEYLKNLLLTTPLSQWKLVYLSNSSTSQTRLSDEDLREIYFMLTDLYPEEVEQNPDPIQLLSKLSKASKTVAIVDRVYDITRNVLNNAIDNEHRAAMLRPVFARITQTDLVELFTRLSNRKSAINRYDACKSLAQANSELVRHVRKASFLIGLEKVCDRLSRGESIHDILKPPVGRPLIIPSPTICNVDEIPFGASFLEIPEGDRMTLHILIDDVKIFDAVGQEQEVEDSTLAMIESASLSPGIYLVEYANGRDVEMMIVDCLTPSSEILPFGKRREEMNIPNWLLKPMIEIEDASYYMEHVGTSQPVVIWNKNGVLTFETSIYESVLMNINTIHKSVFKIEAGLYVKENPQSRPKLSKWRVSVRDGDSFYPVGLVDINPTLSLMRFTNPHKIIEGEEVTMKSPVFVNVKVIASGWGDYGAYIQGVIESVASSAGSNDCVSIDQIEALTKRWDDYDGGKTGNY